MGLKTTLLLASIGLLSFSANVLATTANTQGGVTSEAVVKALPAAPGTLTIPDQIKYQDFLLEPYKPGKPTVVAFKDPYCGYCIRALKKLDRLSDYNVYMFWAGILGSGSEKKVDEIMNCAAPISQDVFTSVINRSKAVNCQSGEPESTANLRQLNAQMVSNYNPNSVPSYYFGGRKVYVSQLDRFKKSLQMNITPIQLDWARYESLKVSNKNHQGLANAIIFLPQDSQKKAFLVDALKKDSNYSWYMVESGCRHGSQCNVREKRSEELRLLLDVNDHAQNTATTVVNGTVINPQRYKQYFSTGLATMLASK